MRMRRKHNLDERLEAVSDLIIDRTIEDLNMKTSISKKDYIDFKEVFGNDNAVELEIGCGKGKFIADLAKRTPDVNYVAIEMLSNIIVEACERAKSEGIHNVRYMILRAECLQSYFPPHSVSRIYINFPTPLPQKGYEKQRLTHRKFLNIYKDILKPGGEIYHKTDNKDMFEFTMNELTQNGFALKNVTYDLHGGDCSGNIMTEHEVKYTDMDMPIYRLEAYLSENDK